MVRQVLGSDGVLAKVPALERTGKNELELDLVIVLPTQLGIRSQEIDLNVVPFDFLKKLVGTALVLVLEVQNRIDEVLVAKRANAMFPTESCKDCGILER